MENRACLQEQRSLYTEKLRRIMGHDVLVRLCYPLPPEGKTVLSGGMLMAERLGLRFQRRSQDIERYESSIAGVPFAAIATTVSVIIILCPYYHGCSIGLLEYYSLLHVDPCLALDPTGLAKKLSTPGRADHLDTKVAGRLPTPSFSCYSSWGPSMQNYKQILRKHKLKIKALLVRKRALLACLQFTRTSMLPILTKHDLRLTCAKQQI